MSRRAYERDRLTLISGRWLGGALAGGALLVVMMMAYTRLVLDERSMGDRIVAITSIAVPLLLFRFRSPRSRVEWIARDAVEFFGAFALISLGGALASYAVAACTHGYADHALERSDRLLRFDWLSWYDLVAAHSWLQHVSRAAYDSIFVMPAILLGYFAATGRRGQARFFVASFGLAGFLTLVLFPLAPARGPLATLWHGPIPYVPVSALYQLEIIPRLRDHALHVVEVGGLHGLVSAPSFHAASALLYAAAAWRAGLLRWPLLAVDVAMLLATPVEGTHYLTDVIAGLLVGAVALGSLHAALRMTVLRPATTAYAGPPRSLDAMIAGYSDGELLRAFTAERSPGPRAHAMADEIDRRGLTG